MLEAVIFDFNGVLLLDRKWHELAWNELSKKVRGRGLSKVETEKNVHGRNPKDTLQFILNRPLKEKDLKTLLKEKENLYQKIALSKGKKFCLAPGATRLFQYLEKKGIKKTIATSSPLFHVRFYYKHLNLQKWFPFRIIVYDDGSFPGKPAPDIYLIAAKKINCNIKNCIVIEDAISGVESAEKAGAGKIILISEKNTELRVDKRVAGLKQILPEDMNIF